MMLRERHKDAANWTFCAHREQTHFYIFCSDHTQTDIQSFMMRRGVAIVMTGPLRLFSLWNKYIWVNSPFSMRQS